MGGRKSCAHGYGSLAGGCSDLMLHRKLFNAKCPLCVLRSVAHGLHDQTRCVEWLTMFVAQMAPRFVFTPMLTMLEKVVHCQLWSASHSRMTRFIHRLINLLGLCSWEALFPVNRQKSLPLKQLSYARNVCSKCGLAADRVHRVLPPAWSTVCIGHTSHGHCVGSLESAVL